MSRRKLAEAPGAVREAYQLSQLYCAAGKHDQVDLDSTDMAAHEWPAWARNYINGSGMCCSSCAQLGSSGEGLSGFTNPSVAPPCAAASVHDAESALLTLRVCAL